MESKPNDLPSKGRGIAIPSYRCKPSKDAGEPGLDEAAAISCSRKGLWSKRSDYSQEQWAALIWNRTIPGDDKGCKIFYEGTKLSIVRDFLNGLPISDDTKAEIVEGLFS
tara:strand:- start:381 stop:710 length:330 start_codon:yes stop_codon:yes gene_type:complete